MDTAPIQSVGPVKIEVGPPQKELEEYARSLVGGLARDENSKVAGRISEARVQDGKLQGKVLSTEEWDAMDKSTLSLASVSTDRFKKMEKEAWKQADLKFLEPSRHNPRCWCGKKALKTGDDGKWYCRKHGERRPDPIRLPDRPGRNAPCPCGSNRKFKVCCLRQSMAGDGEG